VVGLRVPDNFLFYLSAHESCTERLLARALDLTAEDVEISPDPEIVRVRKMVNSVRMEIHRMMGFVRLKPLGAHVLYGYLKPRQRIGGYIAGRFAGRNPGIIVVLGNGSESWISLLLDGKTINHHSGCIARSLEEIKSALNYSALNGSDDRENVEGENVEAVWKTYYASQYCRERRNIKAFHRRMPRKALDSAGLTLEKNKNGVTLDDFVGLE
jgi:probable DNA metabolism protein